MTARSLAAAAAFLAVVAAACGAPATAPAGPGAAPTAERATGGETTPTADAGDATPPRSTTAAAAGDTAPPRTDTATAAGAPAPQEFPEGVRPERIVIPAIGVDASVIDLGLNADGSVEVPSDFDQSGWVEHTPRPGQFGSSVIVGHVDSRTGPAVFFRLRELSPGDTIEVHGDDGTVETFAVARAETYSKSAFPFGEVFGYVRQPALRLVTCGGEFNRVAGSYVDNVVIYAERTAGA